MCYTILYFVIISWLISFIFLVSIRDEDDPSIVFSLMLFMLFMMRSHIHATFMIFILLLFYD